MRTTTMISNSSARYVAARCPQFASANSMYHGINLVTAAQTVQRERRGVSPPVEREIRDCLQNRTA